MLAEYGRKPRKAGILKSRHLKTIPEHTCSIQHRQAPCTSSISTKIFLLKRYETTIFQSGMKKRIALTHVSTSQTSGLSSQHSTTKTLPSLDRFLIITQKPPAKRPNSRSTPPYSAPPPAAHLARSQRHPYRKSDGTTISHIGGIDIIRVQRPSNLQKCPLICLPFCFPFSLSLSRLPAAAVHPDAIGMEKK